MLGSFFCITRQTSMSRWFLLDSELPNCSTASICLSVFAFFSIFCMSCIFFVNTLLLIRFLAEIVVYSSQLANVNS